MTKFIHDIDCSNGLLLTDIGFISANETYAVFSIRVPRAWLTENHFFLNVISDIAGGDSRQQLPPRPSPKSKWQRLLASVRGSKS